MSQKTFSQKLQRLEEIVSKLESPDLELEDGLKLLEEGVALHKECQQVLTQSQVKISKLLEPSQGGSNESAESESTTSIESTSLFESEEIRSDKEKGADDINVNEGLPF